MWVNDFDASILLDSGSGPYSLLHVQILRNLKNAFWPFQHDHTRSLFLWAAHAANCIDGSNIGEERYF
jgi:hypothetical protein